MANPSDSRPKTILIASNSRDADTTDPVGSLLRDKGYNVVMYYSDKVASGEVPFSFSYTSSGTFTAAYNGEQFNPAAVSAAWYRRPSSFIDIPDKAKQYWLNRERLELQDMLWHLVPKKAWLNDPMLMRCGLNKLAQQKLAHEIGFDIAPTVVSNQWQDIISIPSKRIIVKTPGSTVYYEQNRPMHVYTNVFENTGEPLGAANPFPALWQPFIPKGKEWRITVVGSQTFDAAIYTGEESKADWRKHQDNPKKVKWVREPFPAPAKKKCLEFMKLAGLKYGAFDFIETPDGKIVFLEVNANGQYGWLEDELGLPISQAVANQLTQIAG